ncbi:hypothetical protein LXL04_033295 [Taraxacum kok-saghyz]
MGKKVNKKSARSAHKDKRTPTLSPKTVSQDIIPSIDTVINGVSLTKETKTCPHLEKGINFENFSLKMASLESHKCHDCREGITDRRTKKGKKNKGNGSKSDSNSIWVCLECGHFSCGGVGFPTTPQTHAARHSKQNHHPIVLKFANPNLRWCFICNTIIPVQNGEQKDDLSEFVKALKTQVQSSEPHKDINDNDTTEVNSVITLENGSGGYIVRGLVNLGNTCFFNSVMQNLLSMDKLRDYFLKLEGTIGPLTISLKKLFLETSQSTGGKNVINPRAFFGCVCVKAPQFRGFQQHDSHELLRCLLDGLCTEETRIQKQSQNGNSVTFVDNIFGGKISSTVSCLECGYNSVVYEPYLDLSLPLPTKRSPSKRVQLVSKSKKPKLPPKRPGKFRIKNKKEKDLKVDQSEECSESTKSIETCGNGKVECGDLEETVSWLDYLEPSMESCNEDTSGIQDSGVSNEGESQLKVQESEATSITESWNEDMSGIQDSGVRNEESWKDESRVKVQESEATSSTESCNKDPSGIQDSGVCWKDETHIQNQESEATSTLESHKDSRNNNKLSTKVQESEPPSTTESHNKNLSGIHDSEVSTNGGEPTEFDGFGGLFDEPEPEVNLKNSTSNGVIISKSNSESDPDEVNDDNNDTNSPVSVEKCLAYFTTPELLTKTEHAWHCDQCSKHQNHKTRGENGISNGFQQSNGVHKNDTSDDNSDYDDDVDSKSGAKVARDASKRILISRAPPVLTIHLKRFCQDARGRLSKLNGHVSFKDTLDLKPYMDPSCCKEKEGYRYKLVGVVEHLGSMRGGHYVAYVKGDGVWYHASDAYVRHTCLEEVMRCEAYILFYEAM